MVLKFLFPWCRWDVACPVFFVCFRQHLFLFVQKEVIFIFNRVIGWKKDEIKPKQIIFVRKNLDKKEIKAADFFSPQKTDSRKNKHFCNEEEKEEGDKNPFWSQMKSKLKRCRQRSHRRRRRRRQSRRSCWLKNSILFFSDRNLKNEKSPEQEKNFWWCNRNKSSREALKLLQLNQPGR